LRISTLSFLFLALPLLEIAGFIIVGRQIGALATIGLVLASSIAGSLLLRHQGFGVMARVRQEIEAGRDPSRHLAHGVMVLLAAVLLIVPGFITDIFGLLLFLPPVRDLAWWLFRNRIVTVTSFGTNFSADFGGGFRPRGRGRTIDLDEEDFSRGNDRREPHGGNPDSPWRRLGGD
jgi:UPF0716 protein FxsA